MYINQIYTSLSSTGILIKHKILPTVPVMAKPKETQQNIILATSCIPSPKCVTCKNKQQLLADQGLAANVLLCEKPHHGYGERRSSQNNWTDKDKKDCVVCQDI